MSLTKNKLKNWKTCWENFVDTSDDKYKGEESSNWKRCYYWYKCKIWRCNFKNEFRYNPDLKKWGQAEVTVDTREDKSGQLVLLGYARL